MASEVRGVVATAVGEPVRVVTVVVPDPGPGEAVVAVQACGVCHTDLHYREGGINDDFPFLLGHEAAGVVEAVGPDVTDGRTRRLRGPQLAGRLRRVPVVPPGPAPVLLRHPQRHPEDDAGRRHPALAGARASGPSPRRPSWPPASAPRSTRRPGRRPSACSAAGSWPASGRPCFTGEVGPGDSVAVFGCGGVGCAAVAGRRPGRGRRRSSPSTSIPASSSWPASSAPPHTVDASAEDPVEAVRALTGGNGADVCIEAVGNPKVLEQAFYARDLAGTVVQVGVPTPDMRDRPPDDRVLRPGRPAQAVLVRGLPAQSRTSRCSSTSTCRAASTSTGSSARPSGSTTSRRRSTGWSAARCCARSSSSDPAGGVRADQR